MVSKYTQDFATVTEVSKGKVAIQGLLLTLVLNPDNRPNPRCVTQHPRTMVHLVPNSRNMQFYKGLNA